MWATMLAAAAASAAPRAAPAQAAAPPGLPGRAVAPLAPAGAGRTPDADATAGADESADSPPPRRPVGPTVAELAATLGGGEAIPAADREEAARRLTRRADPESRPAATAALDA